MHGEFPLVRKTGKGGIASSPRIAAASVSRGTAGADHAQLAGLQAPAVDVAWQPAEVHAEMPTTSANSVRLRLKHHRETSQCQPKHSTTVAVPRNATKRLSGAVEM